MNYEDLVLDNGELVRLEITDEHYDKAMDSLNNAMKRGDCWSPSQFEGCKAEYMGMIMNRVAMNKVVGML